MNLYAVSKHLRSFPLAPVAAPEDLSWQDAARCAEVDGEIFFPEKGGATAPAKRVCGSCEVRAQCLEYALEHDERFGIWGGVSERTRRRLRYRFGGDTAAAVASVIPPVPQPQESAA